MPTLRLSRLVLQRESENGIPLLNSIFPFSVRSCESLVDNLESLGGRERSWGSLTPIRIANWRGKVTVLERHIGSKVFRDGLRGEKHKYSSLENGYRESKKKKLVG